MLSPRPDAALTLPASAAVSARTSASAAETIPRASGSQVGNGRVLLWDAGFFSKTELPAIQRILGASGDPAFAVTVRGPAQATVAGLKDLATFGTVVLVTHGDLEDREIVFLTAEHADEAAVTRYAIELRAGWLAIKGPNGEAAAQYIAVAPGFIYHLDGSFDRSLIYAGFCYGLRNKLLYTSFRLKGASAFFGFDAQVSESFATATAPKIFCGLVSNHVSAGEAYAPITPKTERNYGVRTTLKLAGDPSVVYPGTIGPPADFALTPPEACVEQGEDVLFSAMPGTGPAPLAPCVTYQWTNSAQGGHLTSAHSQATDAFSTTDSMATYERTAATDASDTIGVTVLDINETTLGTAEATALGPADPRCLSTTTSTAITTTTSTSTTMTPCTLPPPTISRCADFTISPEVVPLGGTFTLSINYTSDGGAPCGGSACTYCGVFATLQTIDGAPADPSGCGLTPGTHAAVFKAERSFTICGAVCYVAQPGSWATSHAFSIVE